MIEGEPEEIPEYPEFDTTPREGDTLGIRVALRICKAVMDKAKLEGNPEAQKQIDDLAMAEITEWVRPYTRKGEKLFRTIHRVILYSQEGLELDSGNIKNP